MKTLQHVTGGKLTLVFNPDGALSSARLGGKNVTHELRAVREVDCEEFLKLFGFAPEHPSDVLGNMAVINEQLGVHGYSVLRVDSEADGQLLVWTAEAGPRSKRFVTRPAQAAFRYDPVANCLTEVVKITSQVVSHWKKMKG
jgi:hypothetical protein